MVQIRSFRLVVAMAVAQLPRQCKRIRTVVMEAAFALSQQGLLNIPDVGVINVKQARAFLWNAAWLQEYMCSKWREYATLIDDDSEGAPRLQHFALAIVGPGGTGKTAVLKITEALTTFFLGPDVVRKLAPSNAAARLLQGDTLHSLCKLPFGKACLTSKRGRLNKDALIRRRRTSPNVGAAYIEVSMTASDQCWQ